MRSWQKGLVGSIAAVALIAVLTAVMVPLRSHLAIATTALVLVVPVVVGVVLGSLVGGTVAVVVGFLAYDFFFIPPYNTLAVGSAEHWVALIVYVIVMLVVARVVVHLQRAQAVADEHDEDTLHLYELSDVLIGHKPLTELLQVVVDTIRATFGPRFVALLLPDEGVLAVVASAGDPTDDELADLAPPPGRPQRLATAEAPTAGGVLRVALTVAGRPVGLLALSDLTVDPHRRYLLTPTPTRQPWPSSAASSASRPCAPSSWRRSTGGGAPSWARCPTTCAPRSRP